MGGRNRTGGAGLDPVHVHIKSLAHGGDGVATLPDGRTVFVAGACPGDEADIELTASHDRWAKARIVTLRVASADRIEPRCPYFGVCGGCQWQHITYEVQLAAKRQALVDALERIGGLTEPPVAEAVPSPSGYGYRNKIELTSGPEQGGTVFGFTRVGSHDLVRISECHLLPEASRTLPKALAGALRFSASRGASGVLRAALRVSRDGEVSVDLWSAGGPFPRAAVARVVKESTGATTVTRVIVRGDLKARDVSKVEVLAGPGAWTETLGEDRYLVSAPSFFQVNTRAAELLRAEALSALSLDGTMRVADLYAGVGTFTLPMARLAGSVTAVEGSRHALGDLRRNLERAGVDADVAPGDAARVVPELGHLDAVLIDPPRTGLSESAVSSLVAAGPQRLVYVSCDPATLARDVAVLVAHGYTARRFVPVDLFPQTYHLETVALFERT